MHTITSKDNQYVKLARAVQGKKGREESGCYLLEGFRLATEAASCGLPLAYALFAQSALGDLRLAELARRLEANNVPCAAVDDQLLAGISATEHSQGVVLLAYLPQPLPLQPDPARPCYIYADEIKDPGNLGTIIRTAHAANAAGLLLSRESADVYNPKVLRAGMGATFKLPLYRTDSDRQALTVIRGLGLNIYVAAAQGTDIREAGLALDRPHLWVLGSEAAGVSPFWLEQAGTVVRLPMRPEAESLNVASAAAVLLYYSYFAALNNHH